MEQTQTGKTRAVGLPYPQGSGQNRPCGVASKPAMWDGPGRGPYLSRFLLIRQVCFSSPAPWSALQDVTMMEKAVEHGGDRGAVAEQFAPVFHRPVGSEQRAGTFITAHDDLQELLSRCGP